MTTGSDATGRICFSCVMEARFEGTQPVFAENALNPNAQECVQSADRYITDPQHVEVLGTNHRTEESKSSYVLLQDEQDATIY